MSPGSPRADGRPKRLARRIAERICERLVEGESLRSVCRDPQMPAASTVFAWLAADAAFAEQYARAREAQADALADEIVDIADGADSSGDAARDRLRIDARKWAAARLAPRKYGDAVKVEAGAKGAPGAVVVFALPENGRDDDKS